MMMERFWLWLAHANARLVFIGALLGLIAAGGWQVWNELHPEQTLLPQAPPHPGVAPPTRLPLLDFVAERQRRGSPTQANPFESTTGLTAQTRPSPQPTPTQSPEPAPDPTPTTPDPPQPTPPQPQPDRPPQTTRPPDPTPVARSIQLRYNGMMIRPDGVTVAWIANSEAGVGHFHAQGEDLDGLQINDITRDQLTITIDEDTHILITRGATAEFIKRDDAAGWVHRPAANDAP